MTRFSSHPGRVLVALVALVVALVAVETVAGAQSRGKNRGRSQGQGQGRGLTVTKTVDVATRLFKLTKVTVDHPLGGLRIRGWDKRMVRIRAVKLGPDGATVRRLKVHADINKGGNGRVEIRTGVLMKVRKPRDPRKTMRLIKRVNEIRFALTQLKKQPKPWSTRNRQQIRKLYKERSATIRALQDAVSTKLVAELRAVPIKGASLRLTVYVPRHVTLVGKTTKGDIDVANLRGSVTLAARRGRIYARNVKGAVSTRTDKGHQYLSAIRGTVNANAYEGDLRLRSVRGAHILANLVRGQIIGYGLHAPLVRLTTTQGNVTVTATLKANGRIFVRTRRGNIDVRVAPRAGFRIRAETRHGRLRLPRTARTHGDSPLRQRGRYGRGGGLIDLRTVYGTVKIH
jgi:Toastrack DUF4097